MPRYLTSWRPIDMWGAFLTVLAGFAFGIIVLWDEGMSVQSQRMEPWKQVAVWVGEATAFAWALQFMVRYSLGMRLKDRPPEEYKPAYLPMFILILGMVADIGLTGYVIYDEVHGNRNAIETTATVTAIEHRELANSEAFYMDVSFEDVQGTARTSMIRVTRSRRSSGRRSAIRCAWASSRTSSSTRVSRGTRSCWSTTPHSRTRSSTPGPSCP